MTSPAPAYRSLVLGGVKSGKSNQAVRLAERYSNVNSCPVILIATATAGDNEMLDRIEKHKQDRNPEWLVVEEPLQLGAALYKADRERTVNGGHQCIVIDCLTLWMTNLLMQSDEVALRQNIDNFHQAVESCQSRLIIVSNETNMGITPMDQLSRRFCDEVGMLHQEVGQICDDVVLMVAGIAIDVKKND